MDEGYECTKVDEHFLQLHQCIIALKKTSDIERQSLFKDHFCFFPEQE